MEIVEVETRVDIPKLLLRCGFVSGNSNPCKHGPGQSKIRRQRKLQATARGLVKRSVCPIFRLIEGNLSGRRIPQCAVWLPCNCYLVWGRKGRNAVEQEKPT